ncbi:hypothetical protein BCIN_08g03920 [Botrytis cinerea B05.10]|uniref:Uncharacterized protein n=1 Tax=Botryotinia fuckeliana (strain B05.10) TaxID=332648 RepID=A0A384JQ84_BOTFB|nr:hypothetical protein BCIN_08g03920 [Botrytis cinerea B05.10]ATZ52748.1 hypothetical protein BCIN_08g03920 [Botrytis cinerea B05.10]
MERSSKILKYSKMFDGILKLVALYSNLTPQMPPFTARNKVLLLYTDTVRDAFQSFPPYDRSQLKYSEFTGKSIDAPFRPSQPGIRSPCSILKL